MEGECPNLTFKLRTRKLTEFLLHSKVNLRFDLKIQLKLHPYRYNGYGGTNFMPIAARGICWKTFSENSK